ncbi:MAG: ChbG/HpnK family deacetylase [Lentisphaerae bacterium]|nr:ChbG/HpnK family deacetylase [Lentisphaerota bacterium]MBT5607799.1 ChbG/HpnK family deacetylase [Lentisphaerota bacterium]MBT7061779.1 ChbG/HpnK family deacetylase [Lentisphaerota bacterium]
MSLMEMRGDKRVQEPKKADSATSTDASELSVPPAGEAPPRRPWRKPLRVALIGVPILGLLLLVCAVSILCVLVSRNRVPLTVRLGYKATDRLLIVNADDGAMCQPANDAIIQGMEKGMITSATLMVPCPGFPAMAEYARAHPDMDLGVHLTHTAEWKTHRWGPLLPADEVPGLIDPTGCMWPKVQGENGVYGHSNPSECRRESIAQIDKALTDGIDITHIDSHMGTMQYDLRYYLQYIRLALAYDVPLRMPSQDLLEKHGAGRLRFLLRGLGLVFPDHLIMGDKQGKTAKEHWLSVLSNLAPGVTEIYIHPAIAGDELRSITNSWRWRNGEYGAFLDDPDMRSLLQDKNIVLIGYRELRDLQRR